MGTGCQTLFPKSEGYPSGIGRVTHNPGCSHPGDWIVQHAAVSEIARGWKDDPETLSWLKDNAQKNRNGPVREAALKILATGSFHPGDRSWEDDVDILSIFKSCAYKDDYQYVRAIAVRELAKRLKNDPDTFPMLKAWARSDKHASIRREAIQGLAQGWHKAPGMFEFLSDCAINDTFKHKNRLQHNPRQTALEALIKYYPDHPQLLELLKERIEHDPDEQVQKFAREKLKELQNE